MNFDLDCTIIDQIAFPGNHQHTRVLRLPNSALPPPRDDRQTATHRCLGGCRERFFVDDSTYTVGTWINYETRASALGPTRCVRQGPTLNDQDLTGIPVTDGSKLSLLHIFRFKNQSALVKSSELEILRRYGFLKRVFDLGAIWYGLDGRIPFGVGAGTGGPPAAARTCFPGAWLVARAGLWGRLAAPRRRRVTLTLVWLAAQLGDWRRDPHMQIEGLQAQDKPHAVRKLIRFFDQ